MSIIDWIIILSLASAIIFFILVLICLYFFIRLNRKIKILSRKKIKNKIKRRKLKKQLVFISKQKKKKLIQLFLCLLISILSVGIGLYGRYYQSLHLNAEDREIISQSYFLLEETQTELKNIQNGADVEKSQMKIKDILSILVSYTSREPSRQLSSDGQQKLRSYYKKTTELGTNLYGQTTAQLNESLRIEGFLKDISSLQEKQKEILDTFGIKKIV